MLNARDTDAIDTPALRARSAMLTERRRVMP
jgi:hypothetical protein